MNSDDSLARLGWRPHFQAQIGSEPSVVPARILSVHRGQVEVAGEFGQLRVDHSGASASMGLTVGDWVLLDESRTRIVQKLEPFALFQRRAAGTEGNVQSIAANVDTLFIVTSANRDFNVARLERYLAIAHDAGVFPVIVITKADLVQDPQEFAVSAGKLSPGILVETMDARDETQVEVLKSWCGSGQTVALLGSSGVGKSTLVNTLAGSGLYTSAAREQDQRGRHTTTSRSMHELQGGGWLLDTPGMRELQLVDVGDALDDVFSDVATLAEQCRFNDCTHESEPGCAVRTAIGNDELDAERLRRYRKLQSEDRRNTESIAERRSRDKQFGKLIKSVISDKQQQKDKT